MNRSFAFALLILVFASCKTEVVNLESLLAEMTDKSALTYYPEKNFSLKQYSSYDRKSVSPDEEGWFANADYTQFIREEENEGRREFVLFDAEGPGAVVRWWMTFAGEGASAGTVRIYMDNNTTPEFEGNILELLSGNLMAPYPLASSVSPETDYQQRGHNLYLPIPYSKNCKITYQCDAVNYEDGRWRPSIYYNINYRKYDASVQVESLSQEKLKEQTILLKNTCENLLADNSGRGEEREKSQNINPEEKLQLEFSGKGKAISEIKVQLKAANAEQALRSTVLKISFDGKPCVWVPVGDFFGTGYQFHPSKTWYTEVQAGGTLQCSWLMPFQKEATVELINFGDQNVEADVSIRLEEYKWKKSSMYFGASWHELHQVHTASDPSIEEHKWHYDVNYVDVKGQGVYVGDGLTVFNTVDAWWGEGDEKIYVDGESFPSCIGTGTEDYYGYAWCRPEKFTHPFIAQPTGAGNFHPGMTVNSRYRTLDAMPFSSEISSNIELWHWVKTKVNYAMTAMWYAMPDFEINVQPDEELVKMAVARTRSDIYKPVVDESGFIEGEHLEVLSVTSGTADTQSGNFGWSGESQLWWRQAKDGEELHLKFILQETGKFSLVAQMTKAIDYGIVQIFINGVPAGNKFNGYYPNGVIPVETALGTHVLSEGENILTLKILGADAKAKPGNMAGIDFLKFEKR